VNLFPESNTVENHALNSDSDFKSIVDISPYPIFIHRGGIIKYANQLSKKLIRADTDEDLTGVNIAQYCHPEDLARLGEAVQKVHATRISDVLDFRLVDRDGNVKRIQSRSTGINFGGELCRLVHIYNFDQIKQAEEEAHQKGVLIDKLIEVLPDSLLVINSVTRKQIYNNNSFVRSLGYGPEDYEKEGDEFDLLSKKIHPDDMPRLITARDFVNAPANTGKLITTEYRVLNKAGEWRWILGRSCSLMPAENGIGRINFGIVQDITEIKANQSELLNYRNFQEKINSTSPVLVTIFDISKLTSVYRSQDMAQWFNYSEEDFPEKTIDLIHPEYRAEAIETIMNVTKLRDGEIQSTVFPFIAGDGSIKFILTRATPFQRDESGHVTHTLSAHSDITDLKEIESKLDKSEETRKAILYAIPDMVVIADTDGIIADYYPNALDQLDFEGVSLIGKNLTKVLNEKNYINVMELIKKTIEENKLHSYTFEQKAKGKTYYFELRIGPFSANEVIILTRDISDQKTTQNKIDHYNKELFEKNQELERYITSNSELEKFAYIASHDLREPLRSLTGFAQLLQKRNQGQLTRESEEFIENIIQGAQRMNTLVSGLLEYSRITSVGKPFAHVNLSDLIKKVRSDLKISIEENKAEFLLFDLPDIYCDELQVRQLFQNLISNAIKFRSDNAPIIKISADKNDRHWLFKVEDNGIGIDMKFKDQVFQIFSRLHAQDKYQGSGIGLSVCKKILERHGGQIWLESTPGRGTTIFFTILI
jgi:PAS domain S-box-containing protein